jgi:glucose/arabinose dehydrogenase
MVIFCFAINLNAQFTLENAFTNLTFSNPVDFQHADDGSNRIFIVEQSGKIKVFQNSSSTQLQKTFLDIEDRVSAGSEMGLLGLAFHPDYENNGYFYVNYTKSNPRMTRISRFQVSTSNPDSADKNSELIILTFSQPFPNHNGGWIGFGPDDGYLYIGVGDGGSGGDPQNHGQNITTLLGNMLRIDIDNNEPGLEYGIPLDNPFVDSTGNVKKEIYAWGMRNPWRNSFDPVTGWLWSADVGQNAWEEIDIIENGKNYGWKTMEGKHCFSPSVGCDTTGLTLPIWEYSHGLGCSVTGGYVYRGPNVPELTGKYIYADYCTRTVWSLEYDGINPPVNQTLLTAPASVVSFGIDQNSELYVLTASSGPDLIYRFTPTVQIVAPTGLDGIAGITLGIPPQVTVDIWWNDNSGNEDGFIIERKTVGSSYTVIDSVQANQAFYTDWNVIDSTNYMYRVAAYNSSGISSYSNEFTVTTLLRNLDRPHNLIANATGPNSVHINWEDRSDYEQGFKIERKTDEQGTYAVINSVGENIVNYTDDSVEENTVYYYRVFAFFDQIISAYSNEDSAKTPNTTVVAELNTPTEYSLKQNYPNPFNPSTFIKYQIANDEFVNLVVFSSLGEEVVTLVNENKNAGSYEVSFSAKGRSAFSGDAYELPSGIYIYQLTAGNYIESKKMILMK